MNKKVIGIIVAIIITLAVVIGLIVLISNDSLNNSKNNNDRYQFRSIFNRKIKFCNTNKYNPIIT